MMTCLKFLFALLLLAASPVWSATTFIETPDATQATQFWNAAVGDTAYDTAFAQSGRASWRVKSGAGNAAAYLERSNVVADAGTRASAYYRLFDASISAATQIWRAGTEIQIVLSTAYQLSLTTNTGATTLKTGSTLVSATWSRISIAYVVTSTTNFTIKVWVDGVLDMTATQADGTLSTTGQTDMRIGWLNAPGATKQINFQHVYVDDSSALTDTGNIHVTAKRPNANGTANNFVTQIGAGGSGYGSGHSPQVNERALSTTNGWSVVGVGSAVTEEYNIEAVTSVGDVDIPAGAIVDYVGWVHAKSLASETAQIIVNNATSNISLTSTITTFTKIAGSTTYPAGTGTDIGIISSTDVTTVSLYEAGIMFAYIPVIMKVQQGVNGGTGVQSIAVTLSQNVKVGNTIIVIGKYRKDAGTLTFSDNLGNTYVKDTAEPNDIDNGVLLGHATVTVGGACTVTLTMTDTANRMGIVAVEYAGFTGGVVFDQTAVGTGTSTSPASGAAPTTTAVNEVLIGGASDGSGTTYAWLYPFTLLGSNSTGRFSAADKIVATTGAYNATATLGISTTWRMVLGTYKEAPAAGGTLCRLALLGVGC